jgi:hypothetical protein
MESGIAHERYGYADALLSVSKELHRAAVSGEPTIHLRSLRLISELLLAAWISFKKEEGKTLRSAERHFLTLWRRHYSIGEFDAFVTALREYRGSGGRITAERLGITCRSLDRLIARRGNDSSDSLVQLAQWLGSLGRHLCVRRHLASMGSP